MKTIVAVVLVLVTLASSEAPNRYQQIPQRQVQEPPYQPRGWRPSGAQFSLPLRSQPQQTYGPPKPKPSYGPPPQQPTTTEAGAEEVTTFPSQPSRLTSKEQSNFKTSRKELKGSYLVVVPQSTVVLAEPQSQNLVYAVTSDRGGAPVLAAVPRATIVATAPLTSASLQALPPLSTYKTVYSPLAASYVDTPQAGFLVSS